MTTLIEEIGRIKSINTSELNEGTAQTAIVMPVLRSLGWDTKDPDEVRLEYSVGKHLKGFADIALLSQDIPLIFIETKAPNRSLEIAKHQIQVLEYCQMKQVQIGVLTNGLEWKIFYLGAGADRNFSHAKTIDLIQGKTEDSAETLGGLLSRDAVSDKRALTRAKKSWYDSILSNLWQDLLAQGDISLVMRLRKKVKEKCPVNIPPDDVRKFLMSQAAIANVTEGASTSSVNTRQDMQETISPPPRPKKSFRVCVRMFGVEFEFKSLRETLVNFVLQACRQNEKELEKLARCLEADGKGLLMVYSDERPPTLRAPRRIGETNYWLETNFSKVSIKRACNRIKQALSLPDDVLVWPD